MTTRREATQAASPLDRMIMPHTLLHGDCLELMASIPDGSVDAIICDLPYGTTACKWDTVIPFEPIWAHYKRVIKPNGAIVLFGSQPFTSALVMSNVDDFSHQWVWDKGMSANPLLSRQMPMKNFEDIVVFYQQYDDTFSDPRRKYFKALLEYIGKNKKQIVEELGQGLDHCFRCDSRQFGIPTEKNYMLLAEKYNLEKYAQYVSYDAIKDIPRTYNPQMEVRGEPVKKGFRGKLKDSSFLGGIEIDTRSFNNTYYPKAILQIPQKKGKLHPTQKPVALCEYLIRTYTNEGETVLDNTMGSGATGVACVNTGRHFIGIEKDPVYFEIARNRIMGHNELIKTRLNGVTIGAKC